ncbi:UNVERIFIED_ORG: glycogen/starch/alpha-glucan phosphorylase-like protein [Pseudomonas vranovensis]|nr:glycogen/starch/alpha-glucan phosphorylase-like protein [Pseudomonas vranovensis]
MSQEPLARDAEVAAFRTAVLDKLTYAVGKDPEHAFDHDWFEAIALAARDHMVDHWMDHTRQIYRKSQKRVYYLSLEFLIGRLLYDSLSNLGLLDVAREALDGLNVDLERIRLLEPDAALGNGGLGRLAACFMESMSTLGIAAHGYGIRYEHGLFRQAVVDGWQQEQTENWLDFGNPWEFERAEVIYPISFGGSVETVHDAGGQQRQVWWPAETVRAVAYDTPVVGWRGASVNTPCACGGRGRWKSCTWSVSMPVTTWAPSPKWRGLKVSRGCCTRPTVPRPARNCACARSISSSRPRCRTCCAVT